MDAKTRKYIEWFNGDDTGLTPTTESRSRLVADVRLEAGR